MNNTETSETGSMLALTIILTNFLLLVIAAGVFWIAQFILNPNNGLIEITRGLI